VFSPTAYDWTDKRAAYDALVRDLSHLLEGERDLVANAAQTAALVGHALPDLNWAGFYFLKDGELVVGPFQGLPACVRIALDRGVCGAAASRRASIVVPDVHAFPGHIACDARSRSELVVPILAGGTLRGVFDMDSPTPARFDDRDREGVERLVEVFAAATDWLASSRSSR
jgi:L-methionine (R)-S-oxide reductase